jgi:hypothetical protein
MTTAATISDLLARIEEIGPAIRDGAAEGERARRIPEPVIEKMSGLDCSRSRCRRTWVASDAR